MKECRKYTKVCTKLNMPKNVPETLDKDQVVKIIKLLTEIKTVKLYIIHNC